MLTAFLALLAAPQGDASPVVQLADQPLVVMEAAQGAGLEFVDAGQAPVSMSVIDQRFQISTMAQLPSGFVVSSFSRGTGAMSSVLASDAQGTLRAIPVAPDDGWSYMVFSVSKSSGSTQPWGVGTPYLAEVAGGGSVSGDIWSYVIDTTSVGFSGEQIGVVSKMHEGTELGMNSYVDFDSYLPVYALDSDIIADTEDDLGDGKLRFFFTVRRTVGNDYSGLPTAWAPSATDWKHPSTIFVTTWDVQNAAWTQPEIHLTHAKLGIAADTVIDGLSVSDPQFRGAPENQPGIKVVLSAANVDLEHELWVFGTWKLLGQIIEHAGPMWGGADLFVRERLGLNNGEHIEGYCGDDPADDSQSSPHGRMRRRRTALTSEDRGSTLLRSSLHRAAMRPGKVEWPMRATLAGTVQGGRLAELMMERGGTVTSIGYVLRGTSNTIDDKQALSFYLTPPTQTEDRIFYWRILDSSLRELTRTDEQVLRMVAP